MRRNRRQAIVLISTMLLVVIVTMILTAGVSLVPGGLGLSQSYYDKRASHYAALTGLEYAATRLQANPSWRGNGPDLIPPLPVPAATADFAVVEDNGNVIGIIRTRNGEVGQFRIRFNWQDGGINAAPTPANPDGFANPAAANMIQMHYVSINNLAGAGNVACPRSNKSGSWDVPNPLPPIAPTFTPSTTVPHLVGPNSLDIFVEGSAGRGLRDLTSANVNGTSLVGRTVSQVVLEGTYGRAVDEFADAALYANLDVDARVNDGQDFEVTAVGTAPPKVRTNNNLVVRSPSNTSNYVTGATGQVYAQAFSYNGGAAPPVAPQSPVGQQFPQIQWTSIKTAQASSSTMKAGTYVWREDPGGNPNNRVLEFYNVAYAPGMVIPPMGAPIMADLNGDLIPEAINPVVMNNGNIATNNSIELDSQAVEVQVRKDVLVQDSATNGSGVGARWD
ncbi:MAG: hypothetical protein AB1758_12835, partial [Candidatus Eremiobacterota bacterium]